MEVSEELNKRKPQIEEILKNSELARNSDLYLQIKYCEKHLGIKFPFIPRDVLLKHGGIMCSIRRVRAEIQNDDKKFPPTEGTRLNRWRRQNGFHDHYAQKKRED